MIVRRHIYFTFVLIWKTISQNHSYRVIAYIFPSGRILYLRVSTNFAESSSSISFAEPLNSIFTMGSNYFQPFFSNIFSTFVSFLSSRSYFFIYPDWKMTSIVYSEPLAFSIVSLRMYFGAGIGLGGFMSSLEDSISIRKHTKSLKFIKK